MARIRTIKPEFFTDDTVAECSPSARLLFVGTWVFADDYGNLDRSAKQLKAQVFPYDNTDVEPLLQELLRSGLLCEYEADGKFYLHIKGFCEHQKIDKPSKPRRPLPEPSANGSGTLVDDSPSTRSGREGKGREGKGVEEARGIAEATTGVNVQAFVRWHGYRVEIRKPLKPQSLKAAAEELAKHGEHQAAVVQQSISNGWQGLFPLKTNGTMHHTPAPTRYRTADEIEAEERARGDYDAQH